MGAVAIFIVLWVWLAAILLLLVEEIFKYNTGDWAYMPTQITAVVAAAGLAHLITWAVLYAIRKVKRGRSG
ncbi:MAG: hypothetical protein CMN57_10450 [Gammaproteobacteria bacterium]|nr:hypothetical protein [Gammaproteobacteria bacterium]